MKNKIVMKNIHVIATGKPTGIFLSNSGLQYSIMNKVRVNPHNGYHINITSDEEIKKGDWVLFMFGEVTEIVKVTTIVNNAFETKQGFGYGLEYCKKIILTTDQDLIKDGVQAIDDEFLEWFVKNPSCEEIKVADWLDNAGCITWGLSGRYQIIIPTEEQKKLRRKLFTLIKSLEQEEPKQERLEEAALRLYPRLINDSYNPMEDDNEEDRQIFIQGAQWQQKQMYSEEEVRGMLIKFHNEFPNRWEIDKWFEQFKKK
jgi:hypothetical protein